MKQQSLYQKMCLLALIIVPAINSYAQQQFTQTVTASNKGCNNTCSVIDLPALNGNGYAVIFITPLGNLNPHPIGAYYMWQNKWSVKNLDDVALPVGATFKVEYYSNGAPNVFVYPIEKRPHSGDRAYIDWNNLNNDPGSQVKVCPVAFFNSGGGGFNRENVKVEYDATAHKWFIANTNNTPVPSDVYYNVMFSSGGGNDIGAPPNTTSPPTNTTPPAPTIQTFIKNPGFNNGASETSELSDNKPQKIFTLISHTIFLTKKSRLLISGSVTSYGPWCSLGCDDGEGYFFIQINNHKEESSYMYIQARSHNTAIVSFMPQPVTVSTNTNINNYGVDLDPGTYHIEFVVEHAVGKSIIFSWGRFSSIMVIPL